jgi:hypothetical protein
MPQRTWFDIDGEQPVTLQDLIRALKALADDQSDLNRPVEIRVLDQKFTKGYVIKAVYQQWGTNVIVVEEPDE